MLWNKQKRSFDCVPTAFANLLDVPVERIYEFLGHDGSEILFPHQDEPWRYRNFHIQEMYDYCISMGVNPTLIVHTPIGVNNGNHIPIYKDSDIRFLNYLERFDGVLFEKAHAVCWHDGVIFDPRTGNKTLFDDARDYELFCTIKSKSKSKRKKSF